MTNKTERERIAKSLFIVTGIFFKRATFPAHLLFKDLDKDTKNYLLAIADYILSEKAKSKQEGRIEAAKEIKSRAIENVNFVKIIPITACNSIISEQKEEQKQ